MIDLSFLTEEEQEAIMKVLQRDAELKRTEEERIRHLPEKVKDDVQLKNMSGQWFYEAKSKRHRDKIHGADIIRASMRQKPATLAEMSQNKAKKAKDSWVRNVNKEVFVPPELHGIGEDQEEQLKSSSSSKTTSLLAKSDEKHVKAAVSPVKQRRNPFNSTASGDDLSSEELANRPATLSQLSKKEILPVSESHPKLNLQNDETEKHQKTSVELTDESQKGLVKCPVPKARKLIHKATDPVSQTDDVPKPAKWTKRINGVGTPPRGILKRSSSSSSTDSEVRVSQMLDVQKKNGLPTSTIFEGGAEKNSLTEEAEDSTQISLEKLKQVRFSSSTGKREPPQSPQVHHSRETGELDLLESDKINTSGNDAIGSDSFGNKQVSAVKPLGPCSSALPTKTIDGLQKDTSALGPFDTNGSVFLVNEIMQTKTVTPNQLETPQKSSSNILPNSNNELSVDRTHENKSNENLSCESKSHKNFADEHQLSATTEAYEVSNTSSTHLQQGKLDPVEEQDAKTPFKPDKHADEFMKVADEPVSQVLDWFKRSSGTEDRKHLPARSQGREPKEGVVSSRTPDLCTEHSGPNVDGKTKVTKELLFGKFKQQSHISPTLFISEDTQLIKERMRPKEGEDNKEQNEKSLTEFDCTQAEERECSQEIKQQNKKSNFLEHQEHKLPAQKCGLEKARQEKRRLKEIRVFWERDKTVPSHGEKEVSINTNTSGDSASEGLRESDKIKLTAIYLLSGLDDQSKNVLSSAELSCANQASRNEYEKSFETEPGHAVEKPGRTIPPDGEVHEYTELPKASNLQPRVGAASASPESKDKDEEETLKEKVAACSQQKPNFQVLSLKEKVNEMARNQISDPSQFQNLIKFWDTGVKLQNNIGKGDVSLPNNTSSVTYERMLKEDKKVRNNISKQELIQQQTQTTEREKTEKLDFVVLEVPLGSPTLGSLNVSHTRSEDSVQLYRKPVISKLQEKMGLPEQEGKDGMEKSVISSKDHQVSMQLLQSSDNKDALKETAVDDWLCLPLEKVENKPLPLDVTLPKEEVAEIVDKVVLPKAELDLFKLGLKKLEKEVFETSSSLNIEENILNEAAFYSNQSQVFERTAGQSHDISPADRNEEISKSTGKMNVPSADVNENKKGLRKLFREFEPLCLQHWATDKDDTLKGSQRPQASLQNLLRETFASRPYEYRRVEMKTSTDMNNTSQTNYTAESTCQEDTGQPQEVNETTEKSVAPSRVSGLSWSLEKLMKEASETPPSELKCADSTVQRAAVEEFKSRTYEQDREFLQEISETIEKSVSPSKVSGLSSSLEKLMKKASETPPPLLEEETSMTAIKPFKTNEKGKGDENTSLDASENNSEFEAQLKFRRASTPLKDECSTAPAGALLCLMTWKKNSDEDHGSNSGSRFSDENSESHSGTKSSTCSEEELNPLLMALKRSTYRKIPSKSLEDIPSATSNKGKINNPKEELALSAEDGLKLDQHQERNENAAEISTVPSQPDKLFSNSEKLKGLSKSVPSFLQEESDDRETDTASERSYSIGRIKKSPSSLTNLSGSSGMASLSSVSGSLMSIYSADFGNVEVKGNIQVAVDYVEQLSELHIFICQCKDLAVADTKRQRSDPYVKTYLLPEKYKLGKRKTSVKKKTFNPVYNEILRYKIAKDLLKSQSLNISVWHNDTFGRNSFLGEVELDLGTWDWNDKANKQINWFPLKPRASTIPLTLENRGEMKLALQYVPHPVGGKKTLYTGEVHIWVKECHDLPLLRGNRLNSFIKCTVLPDTSRKSRQKTRTVSKTANPVFNHTMVYDGFRPEDLKEACIELTVWDHNKLTNHFLGGLRIGLGTGKSYGTRVDWMDSTSEETALWQRMMNSPNTWVEDTLPLRMLMVAKLTK